MPDLTGRVALVTGAGQGIGAEIAADLAEHGAAVMLLDVNEASLAAVEHQLSEQGHRVEHLVADVADEDAVATAVTATVQRLGGLDVMVNNAGITRDKTMLRMAADDFDAVIRVNLRGAWLGCKHAAAAMRAGGTAGSIVNVSSIVGKAGGFGQTNYSAAKAGIVGLTKSAAKELAAHGIRVNAVAPGLIATPMTAGLPEAALKERLTQIPLGRPGRPREVADAIVFLASDYSSYITGIVLEVAGGRLM
ncbi:3-oxoacyl-ACP reductase FabG [Dactylosporangium sp. CA-092794]|uniref:3-oxoacyl-ACP reductase FabG n=1 Tax=Dactylosporangium sp. CA-092794 TaxID=3239929 RepID=UPI003D89E5D0